MSRACARDRARPEPPRQLRRPARSPRRSSRFHRTSARDCVPWLVSYAVGALLGVALLRHSARGADACSRRRRSSGRCSPGILLFFALEKLVLLRHCHTRRMRGARRDGAAALHRRRLPQLHRRRDHLLGGDDVGAARHQHRDRGRRARDSAGGRRRRHPARRRATAAGARCC